jgi:hypothetical protein
VERGPWAKPDTGIASSAVLFATVVFMAGGGSPLFDFAPSAHLLDQAAPMQSTQCSYK